MTLFFGDLHLRDDEPFFAAASRRVVDWILSHPGNCPGGTMVFLGDVVDRYLSGPGVHRELIRLLQGLKGRVIIVRGNHDMRVDLAEGVYRDAFAYAPEVNPRAEIIREPKALEIEGLKALALPYLLPESRMVEEYSSGARWAGEAFDLVLGHFTLSGSGTPEGIPGGISLGVKAKRIIMGHIHEPVGAYLGSFFPCSSRESTPGRYLTYDPQSGGWEEHRLPVFLRFQRVRYPAEVIPPPPGELLALIVHGVSSVEAARQAYDLPGVYIRRVSASADVAAEAVSLDPREVKEQLLKVKGSLLDRGALVEEFLRVYPQDPEVASILRGLFPQGGPAGGGVGP